MFFFGKRFQWLENSIQKALQNSLVIKEQEFKKRKWVLFSDIHKGNKSRVDDFRNNELIFFYALGYYLKKGFSLVLNGDIEEGWSFGYKKIFHSYARTIYQLEREFNQKGDNYYIRIAGNHDRQLKLTKNKSLLEKLVGSFQFYEALLLGDNIIVLHGHQGEQLSEAFYFWSAFTNRFLWKPMQYISGINIEGWARNHFKQNSRDRLLFSWALKNRKILIAGHTHRAIFNSQTELEKLLKIENAILQEPPESIQRLMLSEIQRRIRRLKQKSAKPLFLDLPCYFNIGSGVYRNGLTAIEIEDGEIKLIKWEYSDGVVEEQFVGAEFARYLKIVRKVLERDRIELLLLQNDL